MALLFQHLRLKARYDANGNYQTQDKELRFMKDALCFMRYASKTNLAKEKSNAFSLCLPSGFRTDCSALVGEDIVSPKVSSASKQFSFVSNLCHCSQHIMCFHPANSWNTFLLLLRMIAQIGWALSSTLVFFRTTLEGRSFLVWQTIHQMIRQPIVQSTLQSRPNFLSRHTVTDLGLPTQTTRKAGHQVILLQFTCQY